NVSFNGGTGGTAAQPTAEEEVAARDQHTPATSLQTQHEHVSSTNQALLASVNHGQPTIAATPRPGELNAPGLGGARDATGAPHVPGAAHAPGEPGAQHAVNPATTAHPPGPPNAGVPPHQTNTATQHPVGNVSTTTNNQLHPANNQLHPANNPPPHLLNTPPPHPVNNPPPHPANNPPPHP